MNGAVSVFVCFCGGMIVEYFIAMIAVDKLEIS